MKFIHMFSRNRILILIFLKTIFSDPIKMGFTKTLVIYAFDYSSNKLNKRSHVLSVT